MSAIITTSGHVMSAVNFGTEGPYYFKLGKDSSWTTNPKKPTAESDVTALVGLKKIEKLVYVVPDAAGSILYRGKTYAEVPLSNVYTKKAKYVMLTADVKDGDFPLGTEYNQLVLATNVVPKAGYEEAYTLLPTQITSQGNSILTDYRRSVIIDESSVIHLSLIIEF